MTTVHDTNASALSAYAAWKKAVSNPDQFQGFSFKPGAQLQHAHEQAPVQVNWAHSSRSMFDMNSTEFVMLMGDKASVEGAETDAEASDLLPGELSEEELAAVLSRMSTATQHGVEDIASNPAYAKQRAHDVGTLLELTLSFKEFPKNGAPASEWEAFTRHHDNVLKFSEAQMLKRQDHYNALVQSGLSDAEIYAEMMTFKANQTDYNTFVDEGMEHPVGTREQQLRDEAAYLRHLLAVNDKVAEMA